MMSFRDIAKELGIPHSTVFNLYCSGMDKIIRKLEHDEELREAIHTLLNPPPANSALTDGELDELIKHIEEWEAYITKWDEGEIAEETHILFDDENEYP